jgi:hypothetical protein
MTSFPHTIRSAAYNSIAPSIDSNVFGGVRAHSEQRDAPARAGGRAGGRGTWQGTDQTRRPTGPEPPNQRDSLVMSTTCCLDMAGIAIATQDRHPS